MLGMPLLKNAVAIQDMYHGSVTFNENGRMITFKNSLDAKTNVSMEKEKHEV